MVPVILGIDGLVMYSCNAEYIDGFVNTVDIYNAVSHVSIPHGIDDSLGKITVKSLI